MALQCPGPAVTTATPGVSHSRPQASAMCTAAASWRVWIRFQIPADGGVVKGEDLVARQGEQMPYPVSHQAVDQILGNSRSHAVDSFPAAGRLQSQHPKGAETHAHSKNTAVFPRSRGDPTTGSTTSPATETAPPAAAFPGPWWGSGRGRRSTTTRPRSSSWCKRDPWSFESVPKPIGSVPNIRWSYPHARPTDSPIPVPVRPGSSPSSRSRTHSWGPPIWRASLR